MPHPHVPGCRRQPGLSPRNASAQKHETKENTTQIKIRKRHRPKSKPGKAREKKKRGRKSKEEKANGHSTHQTSLNPKTWPSFEIAS